MFQRITLLLLTGAHFTYISIFIINIMKNRPNTEITWSLLELAGLLEDEDSHVHYGKIKKHLGLHPFHLTNLNEALNEILRSNLNSYDSELQGFLLAYKNPKLLTTLGDTFYDSCFIHVDIEADFYVFKPEIGHIVKGIVNKKGYNHIGVLVHKAFNVSIPRALDGKEWPGDMIEFGQEVKFTITHIDFTGKLPFIRGYLNKENYLEGCKLVTNITKRKKKNVTNESFYDRDNDSDNSCDSKVEKYETLGQSKKLKELEKQASPEKYSKKKRHFDDVNTTDEENKKHSKKRLKLSQELNHSKYEEYESSNDNVNNVNTNNDTSTKKKKRSEKSSKKKSLEESQISEPEFDSSTVRIKVEKDLTSNSDSENTVDMKLKKREKKSKRESKKLKHSDSTNYSIDNEEIQENVKLEHKRHSKKHKLSNSDINDSRIEIKVEESPESDNINGYPLDNHDNVNHRRKSSKKRIKQSVTDSESEIGNIQIKEEKNTSDSEQTQEENDRKDKISKIIKTESFESKSSRSRNNSESENCLNGLPTKHKRKREKTPLIDFENITIKEEKLDDNVNHRYNAQRESNEKKSPRKSKETYIKSEPEEIKIKVEKDKIKSESDNEEGSREIKVIHENIHKTTPKKKIKNEFKNCQSDNSTAEEFEETKYNIFSPTKRSKKSKEPRYEVLQGDAKIKIERSSSVES